MPADFETRQADWLDPLVAIEAILSTARPRPGVAIPLRDALGCVVADTVRARATLPPWDNSAMDGYAVRAADLEAAPAGQPVPLKVTGRSLPGVDPSRLGSVQAGCAFRIMTGAPVPEGADSVIRVEHTDAESGTPDQILIHDRSDAGRNVRPRGEDMLQGNEVLGSGSVITPGKAALLAAAGADPVCVYPRPRIYLLPNGDELRTAQEFDDVVAGLGIPETNGRMLEMAVSAAGGEPLLCPPVADSEEALSAAIQSAVSSNAWAIVTLAGASMGTGDLVKRVLDRHGFELAFWRVTMRPGSPFGFGAIKGPDGAEIPVFSLPGNPASAFVTFQLFVRPWLRAAAGHQQPFRVTSQAVTAEAFPSHPGLTCFHRVILEGGPDARTVRLAGKQASGLVTSLGQAEGLAVVPSGTDGCPAGTKVRIIHLDDVPGGGTGPGFETGVPA